MSLVSLKKILIFSLLVSFGCAVFCWFHVRHHKPSFLLGRALMVANVGKSLAQNDKSLLTATASKKRIFRDYCLVEKQSLLVADIKAGALLTTKFLDFNLTFFTYNALLSLLREIFVHEEYAIKLDRSNATIIDCGSNIGISILFFRAAYPYAKIIGFEADPTNFAVLTKNIINNDIDNVELINKAVSDKEGELSFNRVSTLCAKLDEFGTERVMATRLSDYLNQPVDLLKMDIEGAEVAVLRDLSATGKLSLVKHIIFEFHYSINDNNHLAEVLTMLEDNGFNYQIGTSREWRLHFDRDQHQPLKDRCLMIYAYQKRRNG